MSAQLGNVVHQYPAHFLHFHNGRRRGLPVRGVGYEPPAALGGSQESQATSTASRELSAVAAAQSEELPRAPPNRTHPTTGLSGRPRVRRRATHHARRLFGCEQPTAKARHPSGYKDENEQVTLTFPHHRESAEARATLRQRRDGWRLGPRVRYQESRKTVERRHGDATCMPHRKRLAAVSDTGGSGRQVTMRFGTGQSACKDITKGGSVSAQPGDG